MAMTAPPAQTEMALIRRIQQGDAVAFDRLVELHGPRVYNLAYRMLGNAEDAQDVSQEAFLRIYDALPRFRGEASFTTWMYRIVTNVCRDELSRRRRRPPTLTELEVDDGDGAALDELLTTGESAEDCVLRQERHQALHQAITALPAPFRAVLVLYDLQGFSYDEIAEMLRVNLGTVKSRLNRARNLLREKIRSERELFGIADSRSR